MSLAETNGAKFDGDWAGLVREFKKKKILAFLPGEREYEISCATANLLYRFTRPHFVVHPENWGEVLAIVDRAYELELHGQLTVKCGGHSYTGFSTVDQGIIVDLKRMNEVHLEFKGNTPDVAVIQAGAQWGDVYRTLIRRDCRGYVVNGGRCPSVGVGGFLLGGGLGPFGRTLGMGCDNLVGATIITLKDKQVVKLEVSKDKDPELFWALRGGGTAAFGIVTEFRMQVYKLRNENVDRGVTACRYVWHPKQEWKTIKDEKERNEKKEEEDKKLFETMDAFYSAKWPDEMTIDSNWMLEIQGEKGDLGIRWTLYYDGPEETCDQLLKDNIKDDVLLDALQKRTIPEPSTRFLHETLFLMWEEEARLALPNSEKLYYQLWCSFVFEAGPKKMHDVIRDSKKEQDNFEDKFRSDKAAMWVTFIHSGGQVINKGDDRNSAYPWRTGLFHCSVMVKWTEKWLEAEARNAILGIKEALSKHSLVYDKECASYVNFSDATLAVQGDPQKAYYGQNHAKLEELKKARDPDEFFKWPWKTDTQAWREYKKKDKKVDGVPKVQKKVRALKAPEEVRASEDKEEVGALEVQSTEALAKTWTDLIAGRDWSTYELPPPAYTQLYAPSYLNVGVKE